MASDERCEICDRPKASEFGAEEVCHRERAARAAAMPVSSHQGWIETHHTAAEAKRECEANAVDWRARALEAPARIEKMIAAFDHDNYRNRIGMTQHASSYFEGYCDLLDGILRSLRNGEWRRA